MIGYYFAAFSFLKFKLEDIIINDIVFTKEYLRYYIFELIFTLRNLPYDILMRIMQLKLFLLPKRL